jgi:hypothetical protein
VHCKFGGKSLVIAKVELAIDDAPRLRVKANSEKTLSGTANE